MAEFISDTIGGLDDRVVLKLYRQPGAATPAPAGFAPDIHVSGGVAIKIAEAWDWTSSVMEQPSHFSMQLGSSQTAGQILRAFPKGTKVELYINDSIQATGRLDGREAQGDADSGMAVTLHGRDVLSKVYDSHVDAVTTFKNTTYTELVWRVLRYLNLVQGSKGVVDPLQLAVSNDANRRIKYGNKVKRLPNATVAPISPNQIVSATDAGGPTDVTALVTSEIQCNIGERWLSFLRRYLDPAGLSLWAAADGTFVLSEPNAQQEPAYHLVRRQQSDRSLSNVKWCHLVDDATHQHTVVKVYGKGFGRKAGRVTSSGVALNWELLNPINDPAWYQADAATGFGGIYITYREHNCFTNQQCSRFAWRKMAEERRNGFQLHYRVAGHTLPVYGASGQQAVITEDTVVAVDDYELGIHGNFYIDSVHRTRHPQTETTIRLCRQSDIVTSQPPVVASTGAKPATQAGLGAPAVIQATEVYLGPEGSGTATAGVSTASGSTNAAGSVSAGGSGAGSGSGSGGVSGGSGSGDGSGSGGGV